MIATCIVCDTCGRIIDAGPTARDARKTVREQGGRAALPGGRDICGLCVKESVDPASANEVRADRVVARRGRFGPHTNRGW